MKLLFVSLLILIGVVSLALFIQADTGHIVIAYGAWTIETSLALLVAAVLILFLALHYSIRLLEGLRTLPHRLRRWRRQRRHVKVQLTYTRGMLALSEGRWQEAEKWLLKYVLHSETPALNYLAAAQAAEAQGSHVRRDSYLRAAFDHDPKAEMAVSLAQAAYYLEYRHPDEASTLLARLYAAWPKHPAVIKKLMEAYIAQQNWESLLGLMPELQRYQVITPARMEELQADAFRALFAEAGRRKDVAHLHALWERVPRDIKRNEDVLFDYARALSAVDAHAGNRLEPLLAEALARRWSDSLIYAYGLIPSDNVSAQLASAERWLKHHPQNAVLLLTLGRLSVRSQLWGKARSYLEASVGLEAQAETYRELGALLEKINSKPAALECYRKALTLLPDKTFPRFAAQAKYTPMPPLDDVPLLPPAQAADSLIRRY